MAKYNLIFFLEDDVISVKQIGSKGDLQTIKVDGFKKYEYERPRDFKRFFELLKNDIYDIRNFAEDEFHATVFNMGVSEKVVSVFAEHLCDCAEILVLNSDVSKALMEGANAATKVEKLEKRIAEKDEEIFAKDEAITALKNRLENEKKANAEKIIDLENERKSLQKRADQADNEKVAFMAALFPVSDDGNSVSSSIAAKVAERRFNDGDEVKKGDVVIVARFKGMTFEVASPADGFVFYRCERNALLALGQKIVTVQKRRYELLREILSPVDDVMPVESEKLPFSRPIKITEEPCELFGADNGLSRLGGSSFNIAGVDYFGADNYVIDSNLSVEMTQPGYKLLRSIVKSIFPIIKSKEANQVVIVPCVEPNAPVKKGQKIAEIVKEYYNNSQTT